MLNLSLVLHNPNFITIGVENYDYYNVLEDVEFKEAIKEYS